MNSLDIYRKLESLPVCLQLEVSDFIDSLIAQYSTKEKKSVPRVGGKKNKRKSSNVYSPLYWVNQRWPDI